MAKYRHKTFEMFDFAEEASSALGSKTPPAKPDDPGSWILQHLTASQKGSVVHVRFKKTKAFDEETLSELRNDFAQLARRLINDSRVLLDFEGISEFCAASIDALALFNRKLQSKGSRLALCHLPPAVRASFFPHHDLKDERG